ncbi:MAG TPA: alpha-amylase family glycosyl hydrolase, partial [Candidatus Saccharimonadales bacterium]|nr:alpha-amylase family glycosyl hydrolase [Candidatus Saccharimonadales bacterium]
GKDPELKDNPINPDFTPGHGSDYHSLVHENDQHWPQQYNYLNEMASVLKEKRFAHKHRFMITEGYTRGIDQIGEYMNYYQGVDPSVAAPFIFEGIHLPWEAEAWRKFLQEFHDALDNVHPLAIASYAFGNHDKPRLVSRLGEPKARAAALMKLTLPGMIFVYYGEDIGMHDVNIPKDKVMDPSAVGQLEEGRDPERTPMQWSSGFQAGFSTNQETWLPVASDYKTNNVASQITDPTSFLNLYKTLIDIRRSSKALTHGDIKIISEPDSPVLCYSRQKDHESFMVVINFTKNKRKYQLNNKGQILISSLVGIPFEIESTDNLELKAYEAVLIKYSH